MTMNDFAALNEKNDGAITRKALELGYARVAAATPERPRDFKHAEMLAARSERLLLDATGVQGFEKDKHLCKLLKRRRDAAFAIPLEKILGQPPARAAREAGKLRRFIANCTLSTARFVPVQSNNPLLMKSPCETTAIMRLIGATPAQAEASISSWIDAITGEKRK